jgi:LAO/AO transport system kinase
MKAGLLEAADLLVLNKADRPGADAALADLGAMLELRRASRAGPLASASGAARRLSADVPVLRTIATTGEGVDQLIIALDAARAAAPASATARRRRRAEMAIVRAVATHAAAQARAAVGAGGADEALVDEVAAGRTDAQAAARALMSRLREG